MSLITYSTLLPHETFRNREFRFCKKRRRIKPPKRHSVVPRNHLVHFEASPSDFLSLLSYNWIPPAAAALGFASAVALTFSNTKTRFSYPNPNSVPNSDPNANPTIRDIGEWILFTSPTPFNRFVILRCPSISFDGGDLNSNNNNLVKQDKHYVRLDSGRIRIKAEGEMGYEGEVVEYQRVCVGTDDGGVVSLDWPVNLGLSEGHGMDTTVLVVPGTPEGSMDENVKNFVCECLRRGLFPVVMNPRGCAGSPLTTPRLFTAADSDDICSTIQFITRARPWSTMMGVGLGYGANMLTKYLAEAGEKTPLTAATCINNPFDLDEATRTSSYNSIVDEKLTEGLIDILKSNKELFQGRRKGFDVEKALSAKSVRDFEEAISMVSYGFDTLEEFYSNSSTRSLVGNLKIPVLFIQNDDGTVPLFSIPRGLITENPFTNLLLCSCWPSNFAAISWYHQVTIEWLSAVELGLLKGRHPLLQDIDVTINPSKSLALVEGRTSSTTGRLDSALNPAELNSSDVYMDSMDEMLRRNGSATYGQLDSREVSQGKLDVGNGHLSENNATKSIEADPPKDSGNNPVENDRGEVLLTAQVVMNMLDATMPGTLKDKEKKKVLAAVGRGETLIKAMQDAVPEDVRGKLTSSVSQILQAQGKNLNFDRLLRVNGIANLPSLRSKIKGNTHEKSDVTRESKENLPDERGSTSDLIDSNVNQADVDKHAGLGTGAQPHEKPVKPSDLPGSESSNINGDDTGLTKTSSDLQNNDDRFDSDKSSNQNVGQIYSSNSGGTDPAETVTPNKRSPDDEVMDGKESNMPVRVENDQGLPDQNKIGSVSDTRASDTSESPSSTISEGQLSEIKDGDGKSKDEKLVQPLPDQKTASATKSPSFSVSQALDALTGLDDSTQVAVNSVFGVIEGMLTQLEEQQIESLIEKENENTGAKNHLVTKEPCIDCELHIEKQIIDAGADNSEDAGADMESDNWNKGGCNMENIPAALDGKNNGENDGKKSLIVNKLSARDADTSTDISKLLFYVPSDPHTETLYKEYIQKYILSKMQKMKPLIFDTTTALFLDYNPKEGEWLLPEQSEGVHDVVSYSSLSRLGNTSQFAEEDGNDNIIEPSYVILDLEREEELAEEWQENLSTHVHKDFNLENSKPSVKSVLLDSLKVEVSRRLCATDMKEKEALLEAEMEEVANAVYLAIQHDEEHNEHSLFYASEWNIQESNHLNGNLVIEAISQAVQNTSFLKRVLPVGVIVGSTLAALRNFFDVAAVQDDINGSPLAINQGHINGLKPENTLVHAAIQPHTDEISLEQNPENTSRKKPVQKSLTEKPVGILSTVADVDDWKKVQSQTLNRDTLMVGAVTAAMGASAILSQQDVFMGSDSSRTSSSGYKGKHAKTETVKNEAVDDTKESNIVTSLAGKAMSVAGPIVPTKEGGEVDQERIVALLAQLGQKGGILKLVGKLALLWGGLRGAMSLTDRLFSFLHIADRPLWQRVLGFFCMALVLWSPVLVPLLPTLLQNWATHNSSRMADLACILGLYAAVTILIMQWGRRIRGHEYPLKQYGLDFTSSEKVRDFMTGFVGGVILVLSIQSVNATLGFTNIIWPSHLVSSSLDVTTKIKAYGQLFVLASQGVLTAAGIAFVEELLFRSWLLEEIATDFGHHRAVLLSALAFALSQRSLHAIPGLWLLSLALAGARLRKQGTLFIPIGIRTGILASTFLLQTGGFLTYLPNSRLWIFDTHSSQPFSGVVGLLFALTFAVIFYPRQPELTKKAPRIIRP